MRAYIDPASLHFSPAAALVAAGAGTHPSWAGSTGSLASQQGGGSGPPARPVPKNGCSFSSLAAAGGSSSVPLGDAGGAGHPVLTWLFGVSLPSRWHHCGAAADTAEGH